jgi:molybdopterin-guanine dinucleotide biosynthesis protein B
MIVLAITGKKKSGKTALIEGLLKMLSCKEGVVVVKHIHHTGAEFDVEGTDTWRVKRAGALAVAGLAPDKLFLNADAKVKLDEVIDLLRLVAPQAKVVLLEGFYDQIKTRKDIYRIIVVRSIKDAKILVADSHVKPLAVYCRNCDGKKVDGVPIYKSISEVVKKVESLLRGDAGST